MILFFSIRLSGFYRYKKFSLFWIWTNPQHLHKTLERSIKGCCLWTKITWTIEIVELIKISNPFRLLLSKNNNKVKYNTSSKRLDEKRTNKVKEFKVMIVSEVWIKYFNIVSRINLTVSMYIKKPSKKFINPARYCLLLLYNAKN